MCTLIKSTKRIFIDTYAGKKTLKLGKLCEKQKRILPHKVARFYRRLLQTYVKFSDLTKLYVY